MASVSSKKSMPAKDADIQPMLATLTDKTFQEEGWIYEVKWDGYRTIAYLDNGKIELRSRNNKSFDEKFYPVADAFTHFKMNAVIDGEIVALHKDGIPDFSRLQGWRSEADGQLIFYAFDLLSYNGKNIMQEPLSARRKLLKKILPVSEHIHYSEDFENPESFFQLAEKMQLEGIMAKKADSIYEPGNRSKNWLKIKTEKRQEAVIGGYTKNENTSKPFSALLLGMFQNGSFQSIGTVGTGFSIQLQNELLKKFKPIEIPESPFIITPDFNKPSRFRPNPPKATAVWLKPEIVCEISYRELTSDNALRHPSFKGLREDKSAKDVVWEKPVKKEILIDEKVKKKIMRKSETERKSLLNPTEETQVRNINGHDVTFNNLSKIYWPDDDYQKRDLINYYYQMAPYILPYLKDRPQTLYRFPNGINGKAFYQKDVKGKIPGWIDTFTYYSEADEREKEFIIANDEASLLYIAGMGCIEMNPWSSRKQKPDHPDWCIIDLDPDKNSFNQVIEAANITKQILDTLNIESFCKTSGSTGLHVYIPMGAKYTYEDSKEFARKIATIVHQQIPKFTTIERQTKNRDGKMYIDFLQNRPQATVAIAYSVRPKPGATVSMPLHWDEIKKGLKMKDFTIKNAVSRVKSEGDFFKGVLGKGIDLKKVLKELKTTFD